MPGSRQKKKKKTGKKGGGAPKAERPETAERTEAQKEKDEAKNWVELEKQELAHMDEKMAHDPNWLAFSLAKAPVAELQHRQSHRHRAGRLLHRRLRRGRRTVRPSPAPRTGSLGSSSSSSGLPL